MTDRLVRDIPWAARMLLLAVLGASAAACSISHKSGDFACAKTAECNAGRECVDGYCVVSGTQPLDSASPGDGHGSGSGSGSGSNACPAPCTSCNLAQHTCVIDCTGTDCTGAIACPAGYACDVKCDTANSCRGGVQCGTATSCTVECTGQNACQNVQCGIGRCDVECTGAGSCKTVGCGASCACDVKCSTGAICGSSVICSAPACRLGLGCSSTPPTCHSCP